MPFLPHGVLRLPAPPLSRTRALRERWWSAALLLLAVLRRSPVAIDSGSYLARTHPAASRMTERRVKRHSPLLTEVAYGVRHGEFEDPLGQSLLRAWQVGACDAQLEEMIRHRVRALRVRDAFGTLDPFLKPRLTDGDVVLGVDRDGQDVRIPLQWLVAGLLIAANTGAGKSFLLASLAVQIAASGCRVWISDMYKTQVRHWRALFQQVGTDLIVLRASDWRFNLLQPGDIHPRGHLAMAVDLLVRRLDLPPRARAILQQACYGLYQRFSIWEGRSEAYPCLFDLYEWVRSATGLNAAAREAILDRLGAFLTALTPKCGAYRLAWKPTDLARYSIDFEMRGTTEVVKQIFLEPTLYSIMQHEVERGLVNAPISLFVAFEDGQRFFDSQQRSSGEITPMDELAGVIRGSGTGLGVIVQTMQSLSRRLAPNLATKIMGRLGSHEDYVRLGADLAMDPKQLEWARRKLNPGLFVVQVAEGNWREPFVISVPLLRTRTRVSDEDAGRSVVPLECLRTVPAREYADWQPGHLTWVVSQDTGAKDGSESGIDLHAKSNQEPLGEECIDRNRNVSKEQLDYLHSIARSPFLNATQRDKTLGASPWKGNRIRTELCRRGFVRTVAINPGGRGRRFQLLELTDAGRELLDCFGVAAPTGRGRGGLEHQWWCHRIAEWLTGVGAECAVEDDSRGVRVDIAVAVDGVRGVAVEVEVSTGHEIDNIRKDLEAGFRQVVSLVKEPARAQKLKTRLPVEVRDAAPSSVYVGSLARYAEVLASAIQNSRIGQV